MGFGQGFNAGLTGGHGLPPGPFGSSFHDWGARRMQTPGGTNTAQGLSALTPVDQHVKTSKFPKYHRARANPKALKKTASAPDLLPPVEKSLYLRHHRAI